MDLAQYIYPEDFDGDLELVRAHCGLETAVKLAMQVSGCSLYISDKVLRSARIRAAYDLRSKGWSFKRIAIELKVSERWVQRALGALKDDANQLDLFYSEESSNDGSNVYLPPTGSPAG